MIRCCSVVVATNKIPRHCCVTLRKNQRGQCPQHPILNLRQLSFSSTRKPLRTCRAQIYGVDKYEILIGDFITLLAFCLYKQIFSIVCSPSFPGWTAPLPYDTTRIAEFIGFTVTVLATWCTTGALIGDYAESASSGVVSPRYMRLHLRFIGYTTKQNAMSCEWTKLFLRNRVFKIPNFASSLLSGSTLVTTVTLTRPRPLKEQFEFLCDDEKWKKNRRKHS